MTNPHRSRHTNRPTNNKLPTLSDVAAPPDASESDQFLDDLGAGRGGDGGGLGVPHVQAARRARDVEFERADTTGRYLPEDPKPAPKSDGVDRHPKRGTFVTENGTDPGIDRGPDGRFVSDPQPAPGNGSRDWPPWR